MEEKKLKIADPDAKPYELLTSRYNKRKPVKKNVVKSASMGKAGEFPVYVDPVSGHFYTFVGDQTKCEFYVQAKTMADCIAMARAAWNDFEGEASAELLIGVRRFSNGYGRRVGEFTTYHGMAQSVGATAHLEFLRFARKTRFDGKVVYSTYPADRDERNGLVRNRWQEHFPVETFTVIPYTDEAWQTLLKMREGLLGIVAKLAAFADTPETVTRFLDSYTGPMALPEPEASFNCSTCDGLGHVVSNLGIDGGSVEILPCPNCAEASK